MTTMSQRKGCQRSGLTPRFTRSTSGLFCGCLRKRARNSLRGQVAVQGTIDGHGFHAVLEPDGYGHRQIGSELKAEPARQDSCVRQPAVSLSKAVSSVQQLEIERATVSVKTPPRM